MHDETDELSDTQKRLTLADLAVVLALCAGAGLLRVGALAPSSLWLDDAWTTLVVKAEGLEEFRIVTLTAPGFGLLLKAWSAVLGFSTLKVQLLPFLLGSAAPALSYGLMRRLGLRRLAAITGALVLVTSPTLVTYSTRVKWYALDVVVCLVVLYFAVKTARAPDRAHRWWALAGVCSAMLVLSTPSIVLSVGALGASALGLRSIRQVRTVTPPALTFAAFSAVWMLAVIRPRITDRLVHYWNSNYIDMGSGVSQALESAQRIFGAFLEGAMNSDVQVSVLLTLGALAVVATQKPRLAALFGAPFAAATVLSAAEAAPLGGRTDAYLYPVIAMAIAFALNHVTTTIGDVPATITSVAVALALVIPLPQPQPYPTQDIRPLVDQLDRQREPDDALLVYSPAMYALALYTSQPVQLVPDLIFSSGFAVEFGTPNAFIVDRDALPSPGELPRDQADAYETIWLIMSHEQPGHRESLKSALSQDYALELERAATGAYLSKWTLRPPGTRTQTANSEPTGE